MKWLFILLIAATLTSGVRAASKSQFLYAATNAGTLYQYKIGSEGTLHALNPPGFRVSQEAVMLAPHPSGRFLYAVSVHEPNSGHDLAQVFSYRIKPDGTLAPLGYGPRTLAAPADNVTMDPKGRFLFVSGEDDHLFTFRIRPNGALVPLPDNKAVTTFHIDTQGDGGGEITGTENYDFATLDPAGRFLYSFRVLYGFNSRHYQLTPFRLDAHGKLHPLKSSEDGTGIVGPCFFTPLGDLLVVHDQGDKVGTNDFYINSHGKLTPARTPFLLNNFALTVTKGSGGLTLWTYSTNSKDYQPISIRLASYRVGPSGRLTLKAANAASLLSYRTSAAADRTGRLLYLTQTHQAEAGHNGYDTLFSYTITAQGTLKALGTPIPLDGMTDALIVVSGPADAGHKKQCRKAPKNLTPTLSFGRRGSQKRT